MSAVGFDTRRVVLVRYRQASPSDEEVREYVGSGLLVDARTVLTADHVAQGFGHHCTGPDWDRTVARVVRTADAAVDLAVLELAESVAGVRPLGFAGVDRSRAAEVTGCVAVGYPRWKKTDVRYTAQVTGIVPTGENLTAHTDADTAERCRLLTLIGNRDPAAPAIPTGRNALADRPGSVWGGMSGAAVVAGGLVIGVVRAHNLAEGGASLSITPITAIDDLASNTAATLWAALGVTDPAALLVLPTGATRDPRSSVPTGRRVVGIPPAGALEHWYDQEEVRQDLIDLVRARRPITQVVGRRGVGKSGVVTRVLTAEEDAARLVDDVVFLSTRTGAGEVRLGRIVHCLAGLLPPAEETRLISRWAGVGPAVLPDLFTSLRERTVAVVLDNLDDLQDRRTGKLTADDLVAFLCAVVATPHPPIVVTTSQLPLGVPPDLVLHMRTVPMTDGLPPQEAVTMLRQLDDHEEGGVLAALDDSKLTGLAHRVGGMPRGLQLIIGYLRGNEARGVDRLLRTERAPSDVLDELVCTTFDQLEDTSREIIEVMAVAARPLTCQDLQGLLPALDADDLEDALGDLLRRQELIKGESEDFYRLHPLDTDHVRRGLSDDRRVGLHRRLANWYRGQAEPQQTWDHVTDADPSLWQYKHLWAAGDHQRALDVLADAAGFLARRGAIGVLKDAVDRGAQLSGDLSFHVCRAFAELWGGSQEQAESDFRVAGDLDPSSAEWPTCRGTTLRHIGRAAEAVDVLGPLLADESIPRMIRLEAGLQHGLSLCYLGRAEEARSAAARLRDLVLPEDPPWAFSHPLDILSLVHLLGREYEAALTTADASLTGSVRGSIPEYAEYLRNVRGRALLGLGRLDEAVTTLTTCQDAAHQLGHDRLEGIAGVNLAWALLLQGRPSEAAEAAQEAAERLEASRTDGAEGARTLARVLGAPDPMLELRCAAGALRANPDYHQATDEEITRIAALIGA